ncbi:MAG TPA: hypothetical protein PKD61_29720 [Polyangiaceae bacterium]|nr:hypothetical protein [Polyangiaceae bacterium]
MQSSPESPRQLPPDYVEQVRFSWERELERRIRPFEKQPRRFEETVPHSVVPLTKTSAPRIYGFAHEVATVLRCNAPFELVQTRADNERNAQALLDRTPFGVRLIGPVASLLDEFAMKAMLGHEFGHYLAHGPAANPPSTITRATSLPSVVRFACSVARELTADRFALLACQDVRAAVRLEVASATGLVTDSLGLRELDYLGEVCASVESGAAPLVDGTHPSLELRLFATWLFSESDLYHRLTGKGPSTTSVAAIDTRLIGLLTTPALTRALARPPPSHRSTPGRASVDQTVRPQARHVPTAPTIVEDVAVRVVAAIQAMSARFHRRDPDSGLDEPCDPIEPVDDVESRFRELEARDAAQGDETVSELERRFQKLEHGARDQEERK